VRLWVWIGAGLERRGVGGVSFSAGVGRLRCSSFI
jgi:hypothetical protein